MTHEGSWERTRSGERGGGREGHCTHELPTATTTVTAQARVWHLHHGLVMYDFPLSHTEKPRLGSVGGRCICYWSRWKHLHLSQTLVGENKKKIWTLKEVYDTGDTGMLYWSFICARLCVFDAWKECSSKIHLRHVMHKMYNFRRKS